MKTNKNLGYLLVMVLWIIACKKDVKPDVDPIGEEIAQGLVTLSNDFIYWDETTTLTFDLTKGNKELANHSGDLFLHAGLLLTSSTSEKEWKEVATAWDKNLDTYKLKREADGRYSIAIHPASFFKRTQTNDVTHIAFLVRNADGSKVLRNVDGSDMYWAISSKQKPHITFKAPTVQPTFVLQSEKQSFAVGEELPIRLHASQSGTLKLSINGQEVATSQGNELEHKLQLNGTGLQHIEARIEANGQHAVRVLTVFVEGDVEVAELPAGINKNGVTINRDKHEVSFALTAPDKSSAFLLGNFNDFQATQDYAMKRTPDGNTWWITLKQLDFQKNYTYQFLIDGQLKIADPYARLVLDPNHDGEVAQNPQLPSYPQGATQGIVSVLSLNNTAYAWQTTTFNRPDAFDLVIYELHVRDFLDQRNYKTLRDSISYLKRLGVNAVELMPVQEFEANSSWGYNPSFHFALDKYYGTTNELKAFIDACHQEGIAVILDMVLNHAFGQSPMVRLYQQSGVLTNNPWFNITPTHPFNVGYDFNHESLLTQQFTKDVIAFWMEEFKVDGFRFDLSKGFTQKNSGTDESDGAVQQWSAYDASRIAIWKNYNHFIRERDQDFYVILEHFAEDREEKELASEGMFLWNNLNHAFNEATMGWNDNSDLKRLFADAHGFEKPYFVSYMESHDEERLMYKNLQYGNTNGNYSTKELTTALERMKQAAAFLLCAPGPKMIWQFGELGYDMSIDENGRTGEKPLKWDYLKDSQRYSLFAHYARLIDWKRQNAIFRNGAINHNVNGALKYYVLKEGGQEVLVVGNFDVVAHDFTIPENLQKSWYDNLTGITRDWRSTSSIPLTAGQYYILSINKLNNKQ
ncbi:alpha-amylase family glycosyl hydrolase [Sphingobacterium sp. SGR-19]|uniref:alpha-amylase family glycosyl hydrolase n=1 Tax=Sphingobacterium sp. SGR-19 TaxID=2710886 RepID=UPI0013E9A566|nr:alpha-amylase family glycosyl hydrolase [Sphingobacterium sp. SGR-19]NGM63802.1 1,4-alpha-glucan-branching protein [Sphingobacterium sp. SGR-19]